MDDSTYNIDCDCVYRFGKGSDEGLIETMEFLIKKYNQECPSFYKTIKNGEIKFNKKKEEFQTFIKTHNATMGKG